MSLIARRNWALRLSIILNICVLLYVCVHFGSSGPWVDDGSMNWESQPLQQVQSVTKNANESQRPPGTITTNVEAKLTKTKSETNNKLPPIVKVEATNRIKSENNEDNGVNKADANRPLAQFNQESSPLAQPSVTMTIKDAIPCIQNSLKPKRAQRGDYWVLYNYVPMSMSVQCWESITYTTHADFTFLDNLEPLLKRWQAPVSIALHAPGTDFQITLESIKYLRTCGSSLISQLVTFHIYFSNKHVPKVVPPSDKFLNSASYNCSLSAPWANNHTKMYKTEKKLVYPVNVGRNIARESAATYYVLASDIELYPNPNLPSKFLEMIRRNNQPELNKPNPKVFVLPIFEVEKNCQPPENKTSLIQMLKAGTAIPFHKKLCSVCHNIPKGKEWQQTSETNELHVFHVGKRIGNFAHWEPIFIGTNSDPMYEERLSWEGKSDKMTQGYTFCVLDYDFLILDNAFLVHRPGIKYYKKDSLRQTLAAKTNVLIKKIILPELKVIYGSRKGCVI
ncbi:hypothetical protein PV327_004928 [Microctonus hyperodae]|uniref:N-acetyllactosaminide beta-1,3-N-acetylglucosaminyltransferase n=1 Tax=Microctonus hyperodae TaxID=165561 RepID=A0AA39KN12_MICHY|nr:hypothetical protein PV327_004928 [Microctonus hyperodae]